MCYADAGRKLFLAFGFLTAKGGRKGGVFSHTAFGRTTGEMFLPFRHRPFLHPGREVGVQDSPRTMIGDCFVRRRWRRRRWQHRFGVPCDAGHPGPPFL